MEELDLAYNNKIRYLNKILFNSLLNLKESMLLLKILSDKFMSLCLLITKMLVIHLLFNHTRLIKYHLKIFNNNHRHFNNNLRLFNKIILILYKAKALMEINSLFRKITRALCLLKRNLF